MRTPILLSEAAPILSNLRGARYWTGWIVAGAVALSLVAFFVVPPIKSEPTPELWTRAMSAMDDESAGVSTTGVFETISALPF